MIETTLLIALATNTLWLSPQYKALIKPKKTQRFIIDILDTEENFNKMKSENPGCYGERYYRGSIFEGEKRVKWLIDTEANFFNRKPFACLFCLSFWLAAVVFAVEPFILFYKPGEFGAFSLLQLLASWWAVPFVTVALNRLFSNLKATI